MVSVLQVLFAVLPDSESGVSYSNTDFALWEDGRVAAPLAKKALQKAIELNS